MLLFPLCFLFLFISSLVILLTSIGFFPPMSLSFCFSCGYFFVSSSLSWCFCSLCFSLLFFLTVKSTPYPCFYAIVFYSFPIWFLGSLPLLSKFSSFSISLVFLPPFVLLFSSAFIGLDFIHELLDGDKQSLCLLHVWWVQNINSPAIVWTVSDANLLNTRSSDPDAKTPILGKPSKSSLIGVWYKDNLYLGTGTIGNENPHPTNIDSQTRSIRMMPRSQLLFDKSFFSYLENQGREIIPPTHNKCAPYWLWSHTHGFSFQSVAAHSHGVSSPPMLYDYHPN